jgi:hypothetical protein
MFGWLQIEKTIPVGCLDDAPTWATYHPHLQRTKPFKNDTIYVGTEQLTLPNIGATSFPGAAIFRRFSNRLQLTKDQCNRSVWELPGWFFPKNGRYPLTYHSNPGRWNREKDKVILKTVGRGQEFVLDTAIYPEAITWFHDLLVSDAIEFSSCRLVDRLSMDKHHYIGRDWHNSFSKSNHSRSLDLTLEVADTLPATTTVAYQNESLGQ